jgi:transketolase
MRLQLSKEIKKDEYLLHADMWNIDRFPIEGICINIGLGESNLLNIAGGIASQGKNVYIYGVCGFIIHRLEQLKFSCKHFGANYGKIIIFNAGKVGYEGLGIGHKMDDDIDIMRMYDIPYFQPKILNNLKIVLKDIETENNGLFYIQLGKDFKR